MFKLLVLVSVLSVGMCMPGGYSLVQDDTKLAEYKSMFLAEFQSETAKTTLASSLSQDSIKEIKSIEVQVVAGLNIKYTLEMTDGRTCEVVIFDQVWTQTRTASAPACHSKRQLAGGYMEQTDATDIAKYEALLGGMDLHQLGLDQYTVQTIETQVVAGLNIRYTLSMNGKTCHIVVFDQVWSHTRKITHNDCSTKTSRQLLGGYNSIDINDPAIQQCLSMCVDSINSMSNNMYMQMTSNVMTAKQQVVAGMNYAVTFMTQESTCVKSGDMQTLKNCPLKTNGMAPTGWRGVCYKDFSDKMSITSVDMTKENKESNPDIQIDSHLVGLGLKSASNVKASITHPEYSVQGRHMQKAKDIIMLGKDRLRADQPVVNLLRKKRNVNFLIEKLQDRLGKSEDIDDIVKKGKALFGGGDDHDLVNHVKDLIGQDGHDFIKHGQKILGGDDHDLVNHVKNILGGDDHDLVQHGAKLLGGDGHDMMSHGQKFLGGDVHDLINHGQKILGGDDHDLVNHGQKILGGDDHDLINHGQKILGGDDHDLVNHGQKILGGDDHDLVKHGQKILGGDGHDLVNHGQKILGGDDHDKIAHGKQNKTKILGGDGHDYCHQGMFMEFKAKFNKLYGSDKEEEKRYYTFCDNMRMARKLQETEKGTAIYGATKFADLTKEEFRQYVGKKWDLNANLGMKKAAIPRGKAPDSFDWRDHGAVTEVKNQGSCGSCWAFSTTGNIEGQWAIKKGKLISLSEQELVDCDKVDEGCNGGLPSQAYKAIEKLGGLETEKDYSYKGEDEKCIFNKTDVSVYINDSVSVSQDESEMASWLAANGPISIGINAFAMQFYMGGISHPWSIFCNPKELDHGVLIVGYGVQDTEPYWIVKNSWGADWGEKGYYLVYRGAGVCGLNTMCTSSVVG